MADLTWHYTENQFDNATKKNKRRMKLIAQRHLAALDNAPTGIKAALIARMTAAYPPFLAKYNEWINLGGTLAGATVQYNSLLSELSANGIEDLETAFKAVHRRGSPEHATVFIGGRAPYQEGPLDERVDALENLKTRMVGLANPALADVIALATSLLTPLQAARTASTDADSAGEFARTQVEPLRKALAVALFKNMGGLLQELGPSEEVAAFFDLELLRQSGGEDEEEPGGPAAPGEASVNAVEQQSGLNWLAGPATASGTVTGWKWESLAPGASDWVVLAEDVPDATFDLGTLTGGNWQVRVTALGPGGAGPVSAPFDFTQG